MMLIMLKSMTTWFSLFLISLLLFNNFWLKMLNCFFAIIGFTFILGIMVAFYPKSIQPDNISQQYRLKGWINHKRRIMTNSITNKTSTISVTNSSNYHDGIKFGKRSSVNLHRNFTYMGYDNTTKTSIASNSFPYHKTKLSQILSPRLTENLQKLVHLVIQDFVLSWYVSLSKSPNFPKSVEHNLYFILNNIHDSLTKVNIKRKMVHDILPLFINHLVEFKRADRLFQAMYPSNLKHDLEPIKFARLFRQSYLHNGLNLFTDKTKAQETEINVLKEMTIKLLQNVVAPEERECKVLLNLLTDIVSLCLLKPLVDTLSDPDYWNQVLMNWINSVAEQKLSQKQESNSPTTPRQNELKLDDELQRMEDDRLNQILSVTDWMSTLMTLKDFTEYLNYLSPHIRSLAVLNDRLTDAIDSLEQDSTLLSTNLIDQIEATALHKQVDNLKNFKSMLHERIQSSNIQLMSAVLPPSPTHSNPTHVPYKSKSSQFKDFIKRSVSPSKLSSNSVSKVSSSEPLFNNPLKPIAPDSKAVSNTTNIRNSKSMNSFKEGLPPLRLDSSENLEEELQQIIASSYNSGTQEITALSPSKRHIKSTGNLCALSQTKDKSSSIMLLRSPKPLPRSKSAFIMKHSSNSSPQSTSIKPEPTNRNNNQRDANKHWPVYIIPDPLFLSDMLKDMDLAKKELESFEMGEKSSEKDPLLARKNRILKSALILEISNIRENLFNKVKHYLAELIEHSSIQVSFPVTSSDIINVLIIYVNVEFKFAYNGKRYSSRVSKQYSEFITLQQYLKQHYPGNISNSFVLPNKAANTNEKLGLLLTECLKKLHHSRLIRNDMNYLKFILNSELYQEFYSIQDHFQMNTSKQNLKAPNQLLVDQTLTTSFKADLQTINRRGSSGMETEDGSVVDNVVELFNEIFDMKDSSNWLRRNAISLIVQQLFEDTVDRKLNATLDTILSEPTLFETTNKIMDGFWLHGKWNSDVVVRTANQKRELVIQILENVPLVLPNVMSSVLGKQNSKRGALRLVELIQNPIVNKHFVLTLLDLFVDWISEDG